MTEQYQLFADIEINATDEKDRDLQIAKIIQMLKNMSVDAKCHSITKISEEKTYAYLAGPMEYTDDNGAGWRIEAQKKLAEYGIDVYDPCAHEGDIDHKELRRLQREDPKKFRQLFRSSIIDLDLDLIDRSDMIICHYNGEKMSGTIGEAQYKWDTYKHYTDMKFLLVSPLECYEIPQWFFALTDEHFKTFDELYEYLENHMGFSKEN